jgi:hypothetical protein
VVLFFLTVPYIGFIGKYKLLSHDIYKCDFILYGFSNIFRILKGATMSNAVNGLGMLWELQSRHLLKLNIQEDHVHLIILISSNCRS